MPIILIHAIPPTQSGAIPKMIKDIRISGAKTLDSTPSNIWVIFNQINSDDYLEDPHPPVVVIKAQEGRTQEVKNAFVETVANSVGRGLGVKPDEIWIHYEEMDPKNIWFDNHWTK